MSSSSWPWRGARAFADVLLAVPLALGDGRGRSAERREQQRLGLVGAGHENLDRGRATVGCESHAIGELMGDPVNAADVQALICGRADGGQPAAGNDGGVAPGAYRIRG